MRHERREHPWSMEVAERWRKQGAANDELDRLTAAADVTDEPRLVEPVVIVSSMRGETYLELAFRHPDRLARVAACEAGDIDTGRCKVVMLTGEYDYSCALDRSEATAAEVPGAGCRVMPALGHFPMAENPPLCAPHLHSALDEIGVSA